MSYPDPLDDILSAPVRTEAQRPVVPTFVAEATEGFKERCPKGCRNGKFVSYSGRTIGNCFACNGTGFKVYAQPAAKRAAAREAVAERKYRNGEASVAAFAKQHPAVADWIARKQDSFEFAKTLREAIFKYGDLTEKQLAAAERCLAKDGERAAAQAQVKADAPVVDEAGIDRLKTAFDHAAAYIEEKGLQRKTPRITIGGITISPAKATSANPGALYVKNGAQYLGKIAAGKFHASFECKPADAEKVLAFVADPAEAAKVYGQTTGTCCICNATLRSEWKNRGIGPICAQKFGW